MDEQPQNDSQPDSPQPPVDQAPSSTAPSEDTGGSSPEAEGGEEAVEEAAAVESPEAVSSDPLRPAQGSTNPKTAPVPPPFPTGPVEVKDSRGPRATRPSSRIKEAQRRKKAQRDENLANG